MISREMRRLQAKWATGTGWPKRLDWIEIDGIRGWEGQRFDLRFPIMAVVGENGAGKSTVLQSAASVYAAPDGRRDRFASDFFPDTAWDRVKDASVRYAVREGTSSPHVSSVRKPGARWRGNPSRRERAVEYIDLSRIQPVPARTGYSKLANPNHREAGADDFDATRLTRFSGILGGPYDFAKMAITDADSTRRVPVLTQHGAAYSGFHQGAGETTIAELLQADLPRYGLILIDEVESSLHPRAQRRLIRDLAERCRENELQIILTTHSPYVLEELPLEARACIMQPRRGHREIVYGVSPDFAMSQMDDLAHYECDIYVEDTRAEQMVTEILAAGDPNVVRRCQVIPYGAASVGQALGIMASQDRFPRPSLVFLDGDNAPAPGCLLLLGDDAPERVVFEALQDRQWAGLGSRLGRAYPQVADACERAVSLANHHDWVGHAAELLVVSGDLLWQAMCAEWASNILPAEKAKTVVQAVEDVLAGIPVGPPVPQLVPRPAPPLATQTPRPLEPRREEPLFEI